MVRFYIIMFGLPVLLILLVLFLAYWTRRDGV